MKLCKACGIEKPISEFYTHKNRGTQTYCKVCSNEKRKQWAKDKPERQRHHADIHKFGLTTEEIFAMVERQGGCAICKASLVKRSEMRVDHDHACCPYNKSGKTCGKCVRGVLCNRCNSMIGLLDNAELMNAAIAYINK